MIPKITSPKRAHQPNILNKIMSIIRYTTENILRAVLFIYVALSKGWTNPTPTDGHLSSVEKTRCGYAII